MADFIKDLLMGAEFFHANRRTDRHGEAVLFIAPLKAELS
jgi:hypothetical protein